MVHGLIFIETVRGPLAPSPVTLAIYSLSQ